MRGIDTTYTMKTLTTFFLMLFAFTVVAEAKVKKVAITKVEKAIKDEPKEALKDFTHFEATFKVVDYKHTEAKGVAKVKSKYSTPVLFKKSPDDFDRNTYECKLEKYTNGDGKEAVRIVVLSQIK